MKKVTLFSSLLVAGTLTFTGLSGTVQADEEEGAKTVWGEVLPADADPDGDGWANTGFDPTWMTQESQDEISDLADEKDSGNISQVEFNEEVAALFQKEQQLQMEDDDTENNSQAADSMTDPMKTALTKEDLVYFAMHSPDSLDAGPIKDTPYNYNFVYGNHEFHFSYDGTYWKWSYDELDPISDEQLMYLVHNDPEVLNERPVKTGAYDFKLSDKNYVYHFISDGEQWKWSYVEK